MQGNKNKAAETTTSAADVETVSKTERRIQRTFWIINLVKEILKCWKL